jgi:hypothetical protein
LLPAVGFIYLFSQKELTLKMSARYRFILDPVQGTIRRFFKSFGHEIIKMGGDHMQRRNGQSPGLAIHSHLRVPNWRKFFPTSLG